MYSGQKGSLSLAKLFFVTFQKRHLSFRVPKLTHHRLELGNSGIMYCTYCGTGMEHHEQLSVRHLGVGGGKGRDNENNLLLLEKVELSGNLFLSESIFIEIQNDERLIQHQQ